METQRLADRLDWDNLATDALELARLMPPGPERNEALKLASQLRCTADARGLIFTKRGRPRKVKPTACVVGRNIRCDTWRPLLATGEPSSPGSTALWVDDADAGIARRDWEK
jgi:hypothetical protein